MKTAFSIFFLSALSLTNAQQTSNIDLPKPVIGWDSLRSKMIYPEIGRRAHVEGAFRASIEVDSTGNLADLRITSLNYQHAFNQSDSLFSNYVEQVIRKAQWHPGLENGSPKKMRISVPFLFYLNFDRSQPVMIINDRAAHIHRVQ